MNAEQATYPNPTAQQNTQPGTPPQATNAAPVPTAAPAPSVMPSVMPAYLQPVPQYASAAQGRLSIKETVIFGLIGVAGAVLTIIVIRKAYREFRSGIVEKKSMDTNSEANTAVKIYKALYDGWTGTDEEELRKLLSAVKSQEQWDKIGTEFHGKYSKYLMTALEEELSTTEFNEMNAIINAKPKKEGDIVAPEIQIKDWAKRLNSAVNLWYGNLIPATDEDAIKAVFMEIPTQRIYAQVAGKYEVDYGSKWEDDMKGDMDDWQDYMKIILAKPF